MKKIIVLLFFLPNLLVAQNKMGNSWVFGINGQIAKFEGDTSRPATNQLFWSGTSPNYPYVFSGGHSNICDSASGKLVFLSNGMQVFDTIGTIIENGDSLVPSKIYHHNAYPNSSYTQSSLILPKGSNGLYYVFTPTLSDGAYDFFITNVGGGGMVPFDLLLSHVVDMNANGGAGKVIEKNKVLLHNVELHKTMMQACRHANGVNWWVLKQAHDTNMVYKFIVTEDSVYNLGVQGMGEPHWGYNDIKGQIMFNTKGTQYATVAYGRNLVFLADFNRCTGNISNPQIRYLPIHSRSASILTLDTLAVGVCFSPNDSLLYVVKDYNLYQLDLHDPDSLTAWYRVANMDTTYDQFQKWSCLYPGPDGKIYIGNWNGLGRAMSVIDNPNAKGVGCNFCSKCLQFGQVGSESPPCMPNYELGKDSALLAGCTPVSSGEIRGVSDEMLVVYPNPASSKLEVRYEILDVSALEDRRNASIEMYNAIGQRVYSSPISHLKSPISIDVSNLSIGVYYLRVENQVVKVVVE